MNQNEKIKDYVHPNLNRENEVIAGYYLISKEVRLPFFAREVLYLIGSAVYDNACCGGADCSYALVPGFIVDWKYSESKDGLPVSRVEPVRDKDEQDEIRRIIEEKEVISQVNFQ